MENPRAAVVVEERREEAGGDDGGGGPKIKDCKYFRVYVNCKV